MNSLKLRQLANEIDKLENMQFCMSNGIIKQNVKVSWDGGSACLGYNELSESVSKIVSAQFHNLTLSAFAAQQNLVEDLKAEFLKEENASE